MHSKAKEIQKFNVRIRDDLMRFLGGVLLLGQFLHGLIHSLRFLIPDM